MDGKFCLVFAALAGVLLCVGASLQPGRCPVVIVKEDFNVSQYMGDWYEIRSYFALFQIGVNCSRANYTDIGGGKIRVNNTGTVFDKSGKKRIAVNATGIAYAPNPAIPSKLLVKFDNSPNTTAPADYWVIDTDYTGYSIVWSCHNIAGGLAHNVYAWIISRTPGPFSNDVDAKIDRALSKSGVDATLFTDSVQENCVNY